MAWHSEGVDGIVLTRNEHWRAAGLSESGCPPTAVPIPARAPRCAPPPHCAAERRAGSSRKPNVVQCARSLAAAGSVRGARTLARCSQLWFLHLVGEVV